MIWLFVALLGGLGAVARVVLVGRAADPARGTLAVNVAGAFLLGLLAGAGVGGDALLLLGGGLLGALTTLSALSEQVVLRRSPGLLAAALALGLGAAAIAFVIGRAV